MKRLPAPSLQCKGWEVGGFDYLYDYMVSSSSFLFVFGDFASRLEPRLTSTSSSVSLGLLNWRTSKASRLAKDCTVLMAMDRMGWRTCASKLA